MTYRSNADLGGQAVLGAIVPEAEGELFHAAWEPRVMAMVVAMGAPGLWNIDMSRSARETLSDYRDLSYYEIWFKGLEKLLAKSGAMDGAAPLPQQVLHADSVPAVLARGSSFSRAARAPARFAVGQRVRTSSVQPEHHTRLPSYARCKLGIVERVHGAHVFPDSNSQGLGESPHWLYTVAFEEQELWGAGATQGSIISVDAWEPYLEDATAFNEPWEARTFAMIVALHERGLFTWLEWTDALSRQIHAAKIAGQPDLGDTYYEHCLRALESFAARVPQQPRT
jgi:nitrile hydratase subunit beta